MKDLDLFWKTCIHWVEAQADIHALALVGSHASNTAGPDSDVDLVLLVDDPQKYLRDTAWVEQFGDVKCQQQEDYRRVQSLRVWYKDGLEVEFGFTDPDWAALPLDEDTRQVITKGMRVLFEREPLLNRHLPESLVGH